MAYVRFSLLFSWKIIAFVTHTCPVTWCEMKVQWWSQKFLGPRGLFASGMSNPWTLHIQKKVESKMVDKTNPFQNSTEIAQGFPQKMKPLTEFEDSKLFIVWRHPLRSLSKSPIGESSSCTSWSCYTPFSLQVSRVLDTSVVSVQVLGKITGDPRHLALMGSCVFDVVGGSRMNPIGSMGRLHIYLHEMVDVYAKCREM